MRIARGISSGTSTTCNPESARLNHLNFHLLEVVSRYRNPRLQLHENYSYKFGIFKIQHKQIFFYCFFRCEVFGGILMMHSLSGGTGSGQYMMPAFLIFT